MRGMTEREAAILHELLIGKAPAHLLHQEGYTPREIRTEAKRVAVELSLDRNSQRLLPGQQETPGTRDGGAAGGTLDTAQAAQLP